MDSHINEKSLQAIRDYTTKHKHGNPNGTMTGRRQWGRILLIILVGGAVLGSLLTVFLYGLYHLILKAFA